MKSVGEVGLIETFAIVLSVLIFLSMTGYLITMLYFKKSLNQLWSFLGAL